MVAPKKILVLRFSSMGDVALVVPVLRSMLQVHQHMAVTLVTRPRFAGFFYGLKGVNVVEADLEGKHRGFWGLVRLFRQLYKEKYDVVIDLHDHLRTMIIRSLFMLAGTRVVIFDKGRREKKELVRIENKIRKKLTHTIDRYALAFDQAGFSFEILPGPHFIVAQESEQGAHRWLATKALVKNEMWIGLAPFAIHRTKVWPLERYVPLMKRILDHEQAKFFLFGGGVDEIEFLSGLAAILPQHTVLVAGQLKLQEELALMGKMDKMLTMDSANMHLAVLLGVPVVSVWGGTHTDAGFGPYGVQENGVVEISTEELPCRPCSVYGKPTCYRGDFACLTSIDEANVAKSLVQ